MRKSRKAFEPRSYRAQIKSSVGISTAHAHTCRHGQIDFARYTQIVTQSPCYTETWWNRIGREHHNLVVAAQLETKVSRLGIPVAL